MSRPATLVALVVLCAAATACSANADTDSATAPDDQELIRDSVDAYFAGLTGDYATFESALCPELAADILDGVDEPTFQVGAADDVQTNGRPVVDWFDDVSINGAQADVTLSVNVFGGTAPDVGPQTWTTTLERDGDDWAVCSVAAPDDATQHKLDVALAERDAQAAVQQFYAALAEKDFTTAESVSCAPLREQIPANDPVAYESLEKLISIDAVTVNGDSARVTATVELPDGTQLPLNYVVERQRNSWKVCDAL